jgi:hypothetical protein
MSGGVRNPGQTVQFYPARRSFVPKLEPGWSADRTSCRQLRQIGFMTRPTQNRSRHESRGTREVMAGHRGCEKFGPKRGKGRKKGTGKLLEAIWLIHRTDDPNSWRSVYQAGETRSRRRRGIPCGPYSGHPYT